MKIVSPNKLFSDIENNMNVSINYAHNLGPWCDAVILCVFSPQAKQKK